MKKIAELRRILGELLSSGQLLSEPASPTLFNLPYIKEYFKRTFQENMKADGRVEKILATAVVKYSMGKMGMNKEEALQAARNAVSFLRDSRAKKLLQEGKITEYGYEMYGRFIHSAWVKGAVKAAVKHTAQKVKKVLNVVIEKTPLRVLKPAIELVKSAIPEEVKEKAKSKAKELVKKAAEKLPEVVEPLLEMGYKVAKKVTTAIAVGVEKAKEKGKEFLENHPVAKKVYEGVKTVAKTFAKRIPILGRLFS
ncbi:MAG: hypothetical protein MJZ94_10080 [Bacteroidales bacterium]|nr:hypothetical protein [Bacteroidales bacterium]